MDADSSFSPPAQNRRPSLPQVRPDPDFDRGRPMPDVRRGELDEAAVATERTRSVASDTSGLAAGFPLLFLGAGCLAAAVLVQFEGPGASIGRIPLWIPLVAVGIVALIGGTLTVFAEPDPEPSNPAPAVEPRNRGVPPLARAASPGPRPAREPAMVRTSRPAPTVTSTPISVGASAPREPGPRAPPPNKPREGPAPMAVEPEAVGLDASALLEELDRIDAELHVSRPRDSKSAAGVPTVSSPRPTVPPVHQPPQPVMNDTANSTYRPYEVEQRPESESPARTLRCVGCGSAILDAGAPAHCDVCGEPLCSECRDRSRAEGKPNLCPICGLLDAVHARGPRSATTVRPRA